jgi:hypothetical protein
MKKVESAEEGLRRGSVEVLLIIQVFPVDVYKYLLDILITQAITVSYGRAKSCPPC